MRGQDRPPRGTALASALAVLALVASASAQEAEPSPPAEASAVGSPEPEEAAEAAAGDEAPSGPTTVYLGAYPIGIRDLDMQAGTATVTYYVWTRWRGEIDGTAYELVNGSVDAREHAFREDVEGEHYAYYRCRASVSVEADYHDFPFDDHLVALEIEHSDEGEEAIVFAIDEASVAHAPSPSVSGWLVDPPRFELRHHTYETNWGYPGSPAGESTTFSQVRVTMRMHHDVVATAAKTFLTLLISVLITFLGFFMGPSELEARVGVGVAGIFGAVTSQAVVAGNIPEIPYLTLSDRIHIAGLVFIFLALFESVVVGGLCRQGREATARRLDGVARVVALPSFALIVALFVVFR